VPKTGCCSVVLLPIMNMQRLFSAISRIELVIAPLPKLVTRPVTVALCHNRAQWSMLLVPSTCRVSLLTR
jgi:hypothetical protein